MARPEYQPTQKDRAAVQTMAAYGIPQPDIAAVVGCDEKTLRKHFRQELDTAATQANARVAAALFRKATGDAPSSVAAAIFWLKARAGWQEARDDVMGKMALTVQGAGNDGAIVTRVEWAIVRPDDPPALP